MHEMWSVGPRPGFFGRRRDEIVAYKYILTRE